MDLADQWKERGYALPAQVRNNRLFMLSACVKSVPLRSVPAEGSMRLYHHCARFDCIDGHTYIL